MRLFFSVLSFVIAINFTFSQTKKSIKATVLSKQENNIKIQGSAILEGTSTSTEIILGTLLISTIQKGNYILKINAEGYTSIRLPISIAEENIDLGIIYLEKDITTEKTDNLISLTEVDISNDESTTITSGLLQATKDIFLNRAAFDFGQAFFRVRGYNSEYSQVLLNGILMNNLTDGRLNGTIGEV